MNKVNKQTEQSNSTKPVLANRILKFRAWTKEQNRMIKVFGFNEHLVFEQTWDSPSIKENIFEIEDFHIMQFTGLVDKNGTEIYEGDIIKRIIGFQGNENISFDLISFHGAHFSATRFSPDLRTEGFLGNWTFHTMEIIGNYFENPELLTQTTS